MFSTSKTFGLPGPRSPRVGAASKVFLHRHTWPITHRRRRSGGGRSGHSDVGGGSHGDAAGCHGGGGPEKRRGVGSLRIRFSKVELELNYGWIKFNP